MALTNTQFSQAPLDATLNGQFNGSMLKLAGFILNGDAALPVDLLAARKKWANAALNSPGATAFLVASAARWLRFSVGTSGIFLSASSLVVTDANIDSMVGVIAGNLVTLQTLENAVVFP